MKMWSLNVIILLLFCYASLLTCDGRVYFVSKNFYNILHWDPVEPAFPGEKALYSVQYCNDTDYQQFQIKKECQNITDLFCDLTAETPSVYDVQYRAQVFSNGSLRGSHKFKPIAQTIFGPPILFKHTTVSSLHVNVTLPLGPNGESVEDIIIKSKKGPEEVQIRYTLNIIKPKWAARVNVTTTGRFVINLKNNQTEYCGNVFYTPSTEGRLKSENATFCVKLPDDPLMLLPWLLVSAALLTTIIIVSVVYMCNYVKAGKEKSKLLVSTFSSPQRVLSSPDRNIVISKPEIYVQSERTVYSTVRVETNRPVVGPGGYSPQDVPWQDSDCSSVETSADSVTSKHENTGGQSSESYGAVAVHVPATQNEDFQQANDKREPSNNPARPLLLQTERDTNGQLVLPSLMFQLQSGTDDIVSPLNSERKPLLSDLIDSKTGQPSLDRLQSFDSSKWSDSGFDDGSVHTPTQPYCNTHFSPSQPVASYFPQGCQNTSKDTMFETGYKESWMPAIPLGNASKDSCEYRKTNYPWTRTGLKKEEEDMGEEEVSRQILLGGWGVQVQE
ncbi:interferon lambda receptor 1 [Trematomus bernacchii]|uniref:interferon lambda receptor 1 n=1 Tax=Trematomus bernacchii TaxID=40690 RepID=UPI001469BF66|nr:interferon lambda receptor 1 [Trematomus bernacchii]